MHATIEPGISVEQRLEQALAAALERSVRHADAAAGPPRLREAMEHAVFPGGARIRPRLTLAVAAACGEPAPDSADAAAAAIELLHCASLVHDDLPCFDDAALRRGRPSVQAAYGEPLAVLTGDALIVAAFDVLTLAQPAHLASLVAILARAVGAADGICAGQAWECEDRVDLASYHRAKTGALFAGATAAGAAACGRDGDQWRELGARLGEAYQVADDLRDVAGRCAELGKPVGQDARLGRPSAVAELGLAGAVARLKTLVCEAVATIPECPGSAALRRHILDEARQLVPSEVARRVA